MEKLPRYIPIDYAKYAPDIPQAKREAYFGLPRQVQFCKECVMSNQKPNSCYEFEHTPRSQKKTMVIQPDGVCDACHACRDKEVAIDWAAREAQLRELCARLPGAGQRRQGQLLRRAPAEIQIRHAPAYRHLGAAHVHALGLEELSGVDPRRV